MEKVLDNFKGVVLFYIFIALISLFITLRVDELNSEANAVNTETINDTYYA